MAVDTYTLKYAGTDFVLSSTDHSKLRMIYNRGLAVGGVLFKFTPVDSTYEVEIAVGSGTQFVLVRNPPS